MFAESDAEMNLLVMSIYGPMAKDMIEKGANWVDTRPGWFDGNGFGEGE